jgi:hypothetical protein
VKEIGLAGRQQFLQLFGFDRPLKDHASRTEVASPTRPYAVFANVSHRMFKYAPAAFRAGTQRRLAREIDRQGAALSSSLLAEIELRTKFRSEPHHRRERLPRPAAESRERTN